MTRSATKIHILLNASYSGLLSLRDKLIEHFPAHFTIPLTVPRGKGDNLPPGINKKSSRYPAHPIPSCNLGSGVQHSYLTGLNDVRLGPFLTDWPAAPFEIRIILPNPLPVFSCFPTVVQATQTEVAFIVKDFIASAQYLQRGQTYAAEDFGAEFLEKYGWAEMIGQRGPVASDHIACGFLRDHNAIHFPRPERCEPVV